METIKWQFAEVGQGVRENEQTQEEFFSNADIVSEVSGLVRESIQNSLDESHDPKQPIHMVFTIGRQKASIANQYFGELYPHIGSTNLREIPDFAEDSSFLVIEDFNTLGLEGPTTSTFPSDEVLADLECLYKHSFYFFEWKSGLSNKRSGNRGSWGVGKIVFPRASQIKSYLVLSSRRKEAAPDGDPSILFGHSILKYRTLHGKRYVPDCQWMQIDSEGLPRPTKDREAQRAFIEDWQLARKPDQLGTSIVVPFCRDSITGEAILKCIIGDYFLSIMGGQLVCTVRDEGGSSTEINRSTIIQIVESMVAENSTVGGRSAEDMKTLCAMFESYEGGHVFETAIHCNPSRQNKWDGITVPQDDLDQMTNAFNSGQILSVKVNSLVPQMINPPKESEMDSFIVLLKKVQDKRSRTIFCREGILIPNANTASNLQNCVSLVIVGNMRSAGEIENSLADLLRNAEGPSHENWSATASNFKGRYQPKYLAEDTIRWVKQSADRCLRLIQGAESFEDDFTLSKFFPYQDDGVGPGPIKVVLSGRRNPADVDQAIFSWRADGIVILSYELKQLLPSEKMVEQGGQGINKATGALDQGTEVTYKYQLLVNDGLKIHESNIVAIGPEVVVPIKAKIEIEKTQSGFRIVPQAGTKLQPGYRFIVRVAYRSRGVNKLKWDHEDFLLKQKVSGQIHGLTIHQSTDNYCQFEVSDSDFSAEWHQFDQLRDLVIDASEDF